MRQRILLADLIIGFGAPIGEYDPNRDTLKFAMKARDVSPNGVNFIVPDFNAIKGSLTDIRNDSLAAAKQELEEETSFKLPPPPRTLDFGSLWFVLHYNSDGTINSMEEHDWREGGHIGKPTDKSWEDFFVERVSYRSKGSEQLARDFLTSTGNWKR